MTLTIHKIHSQHYELRDPSRDGGDGQPLIVARVYEKELAELLVRAAREVGPVNPDISARIARSRARNAATANSPTCSVPDEIETCS